MREFVFSAGVLNAPAPSLNALAWGVGALGRLNDGPVRIERGGNRVNIAVDLDDNTCTCYITQNYLFFSPPVVVWRSNFPHQAVGPI